MRFRAGGLGDRHFLEPEVVPLTSRRPIAAMPPAAGGTGRREKGDLLTYLTVARKGILARPCYRKRGYPAKGGPGVSLGRARENNPFQPPHAFCASETRRGA